jgi:hypothetical protein
LDASEEFLESLANFDKNHKFRLANKRFFITGGIRKDSAPSQPVPQLPSGQVTSLLNANMRTIIDIANKQVEERRKQLATLGFRVEENL